MLVGDHHDLIKQRIDEQENVRYADGFELRALDRGNYHLSHNPNGLNFFLFLELEARDLDVARVNSNWVWATFYHYPVDLAAYLLCINTEIIKQLAREKQRNPKLFGSCIQPRSHIHVRREVAGVNFEVTAYGTFNRPT